VIADHRKELSLKEVKSILDQLSEEGTLFLTFTGGEILTRNDFFDIASYAREKGFALRLFTNGTLITSEVADRIKEFSPFAVEMSIYGSNPTIHDGVTRFQGSWELSVNALQYMKERNIKTYLKCTIMKQNIGDYEQIRLLAEKLGAEVRFSVSLSPRNDGSKTPLSYRISEEELYQFFSDLYEHSNNLERTIPELIPKEILPCRAAISSCSISPYGDVRPCIQLLKNAGNLRMNSFHDIWTSSAELKRIRDIRLSDLPVCSKCNLFLYCNRCAGLALLENVDLLGPSSEACIIAKIRKEVMRNDRREKSV
jgi:radical SAM protein with 4Fe4S-binding SPASM domain